MNEKDSILDRIDSIVYEVYREKILETKNEIIDLLSERRNEPNSVIRLSARLGQVIDMLNDLEQNYPKIRRIFSERETKLEKIIEENKIMVDNHGLSVV